MSETTFLSAVESRSTDLFSAWYHDGRLPVQHEQTTRARRSDDKRQTQPLVFRLMSEVVQLGLLKLVTDHARSTWPVRGDHTVNLIATQRLVSLLVKVHLAQSERTVFLSSGNVHCRLAGSHHHGHFPMLARLD